MLSSLSNKLHPFHVLGHCYLSRLKKQHLLTQVEFPTTTAGLPTGSAGLIWEVGTATGSPSVPHLQGLTDLSLPRDCTVNTNI